MSESATREKEGLSESLIDAQRESLASWTPSTKSDALSSCVDRRVFLRGGAALVGGAALGKTLGTLLVEPALAHSQSAGCGEHLSKGPYGSISPVRDGTTNLKLLRLPEGFKYWSYGWTGDPIATSLGNNTSIPTPPLHDGMAVVRQVKNQLVLVRNHEVNFPGPAAFGEAPNIYSPAAGGGCSNLVFDLTTGKFVTAFASQSGTIRNCSGGVTPWGTWFTCEETSLNSNSSHNLADSLANPHGYVFEVGPAGALENPPASGGLQPYTSMGRFSHEALAVDPLSGIVYETEDGPTVPSDAGSGFYRFLMNVPGQAWQGGELQMLRVKNQPNFDFQFRTCSDGPWQVEWVTVANPDPDLLGGASSCFQQGYDQGGASFRRLEGCWYGKGKIYFVATDGGPVTPSGAGEGQVFEYDPIRERLKIIFVSTHPTILENPDNIVVAPDGSIFMCEDNAAPPASNQQVNAGERLIILRPDGRVGTFAQNNLDFRPGLGSSYPGPFSRSGFVYNTDQRQNEWAGAVFSPDGKWLFINIQTPGITFAITGPWDWLERDDDRGGHGNGHGNGNGHGHWKD